MVETYLGRGMHRSTVETLGLRIVSGQLVEGATLDVVELQREFDVSLTVIREALRVLAAKGLVEARQKRGTFVRARQEWQLLDGDVMRWQFGAEPTPTFFRDLSELRAMVEPSCARLAAERRDDADLAALEDALAAMARADEPAAEVEADLAFHQALLHATHNELVTRLDVLIRAGLETRDRVVHESRRVRADPVPTHRAVLLQIQRADGAGAERAMRQLVDRSVADLARSRSR